MKIMIIGAHPSGNKGAEAMLEILTKKLSQNYGNIEFVFESLNGKENYKNFKEQKFNFEIILFNAKKIFSPYSSNLKEIDYVIDIGGLAYTDKSLKANLRSFIKHFSIISRRKKLIFFTQDFGPANKFHTKFLGNIIFSFSKKIFARSTFTKNTLLNSFRINENKILGPFPDSTLLLKDSSIENIIRDENYVIISPSAVVYNSKKEEYINLIDNLINHISKNSKVYLLVHSFTKNASSSDSFVIDEILKINKNAIKINSDLNPIILKKVLSEAKYVISSRYHVIVGAMSSNVPAIAIGWNEKYKSFLSLYNMQKNNIEFNDKSFETISDLTNNFDMNNTQVKQKIQNINLNLYKDVEESFELLFKELYI